MKCLTFFILFLFWGILVKAQTPQSFRYQAVSRDNSGAVLANQEVSFRISILSGSTEGITVYSETHTGKTTNAFGLIDLEIGKGTPVTGTFSAINWSINSYFVKIEMDPDGGTNYQDLNTSQLLSVPYALHAKTVETGDNWGSESVVTDATLTGNGTQTAPLQIARQTAMEGQVMKWNGSAWIPADDDTTSVLKLTLPYKDRAASENFLFHVINDGQGGGIRGETIGNAGVLGLATGSMASNIGAAGQSPSPFGIGIWGNNIASTGNGIAVKGTVESSTGYSGFFERGRFYVEGNTGIGTLDPSAKLEVAGQVKISGGNPGNGKVLTSDAAGLATWETPSEGGLSLPYEGTGSFSDVAFSVRNDQMGSNAIRGIAGSTSPWSNVAVEGINYGESGRGVSGIALATSGTPYGIRGEVISVNGYSGYFLGGKFYISGNTGIGTDNPAAKLEVAGQVKITGGSPGAGKVLTSDASGLASWQSPAGSPFSSAGGITSNTPITDHLVFGSSSLDDVAGTADDIRLFFNKTKGAFRAGRATGTEWNTASVGNYSAAFGDNNKASGSGSFASGVASVASGSTSTAMGYFVNATAMLSTAVGSYNVGAGTKDSWVDTDPIFEIGIGTPGATRTNAFTVLKNGYTGIGTHTPSQKLHIKGSAAGNAVVFIEPNIWNAAGDYGEIRFGDANHYIRGEHTNGMTFYDTDKFNFTGGNVGIGTANPGYKLDVSGNRIRLIEAGTNDWIAMRTDGGSNDYLDFSWGGGSLVMQGATTNENIILNPSMNKVGIRTWSPMYDLDVTGNIRATGSVYYGGTAGSANGTAYTKPDYVFAEDYETLSVSEVEDFLKNKNHLPWVTSAKQEKHENGEATDMTRMAFETLETVENLQLQIISQQRLIKEQLTKIESLQTRLEQIEIILKTSK